MFDEQPDGDPHGECVAEIHRLQAAIALAYGYLWHVNNEPMAPVPMYSPEKASYEARKVLRDLMTHEQRGEAINKVQGLLGHNAVMTGPLGAVDCPVIGLEQQERNDGRGSNAGRPRN